MRSESVKKILSETPPEVRDKVRKYGDHVVCRDPEVEEWLKTVTDEQWQFATKLRDDLKGNMGTRGKMLIAKALESYASQFRREGVEGQAVDIDEFLQSYYGAPKPTGQMQCEYDNLFDLLLAFQKRFKGVEGQKEARISELEAENKRLREVLEKVNHAIYSSNMRGTILHLEVRNALNPKPPKEQ